MAFKMKGNPMKRNFGVGKEAPYFTKQKNTNINRGDDKGNPTAAFQMHDGKKFEDPGFMDSHFTSGAPRSAAKKYKSAMKHDRGSYEKGLPDHLANKFHKEEVDGHRHDAAGNKLVILGKSKKAPTKFVGKTIKKIKSKYKAKRQLKKGGKGEDDTKLTVALSAPTKMKKPSAVKNEFISKKGQRLIDREKKLKAKHTKALEKEKQKKAERLGEKRLRLQEKEQGEFTKQVKKKYGKKSAMEMKKPAPTKNKPDSSKTKVKYKDGVINEKYYYDKDGNYLGKATGLAGSTKESRKALLESKRKG